MKRTRLRPRYPVWSVKSITALGLLVAALAAALVFTLGRKPLIVETEITLGVVAGCIFLFLAVGLYQGVRIRKESLDLRRPSADSIGDWSGWDVPDVGDFGLDADDGCLGALAGVLLSLIVGVLLVVLFWLLINVFWGAFAVLALALFWAFNRALRQVFARSRTCRGRLAPSLGYALTYTALYTGWLFALAWGVDRMMGR